MTKVYEYDYYFSTLFRQSQSYFYVEWKKEDTCLHLLLIDWSCF